MNPSRAKQAKKLMRPTVHDSFHEKRRIGGC